MNYNEEIFTKLINNECTPEEKETYKDIILVALKKAEVNSRNFKAYTQALARFNVEHPEDGYVLAGYVFEEIDKLNKNENN